MRSLAERPSSRLTTFSRAVSSEGKVRGVFRNALVVLERFVSCKYCTVLLCLMGGPIERRVRAVTHVSAAAATFYFFFLNYS